MILQGEDVFWFYNCSSLTHTGGKAGDPASPTVLKIVYNICLRMIATSGHTVTTKGVGSHNAGGYADNTVIITKSPTSMRHILDNVLATFCDFTGLKVNLTKTKIYAMDNST